MKTYLTKAIACAIVLTTCFSCSIEPIDNPQSITITSEESLLDPCTGVNPTARLTNNGDVNFDLEIYTIDGILLNHEYNIAPGSASTWKSFVPGETMFSVTNSTYEDEKVIYTMNTCMEFDMEIGVDNKLTSATPVTL